MIAFEYSQLPARVVFGFGTIARIPDEVQTLGCRRVLVLCDPHHAADAAARVIDTLGDAAVGLSIDAAMHTPVEITDRVMEQVNKTKADCLLSLGGGSAPAPLPGPNIINQNQIKSTTSGASIINSIFYIYRSPKKYNEVSREDSW